MTDQQTERVMQDNPPVPTVIIGAWKEALDHSGLWRVYLVGMIAVMTIPFLPLWALLWAFQKVGLYHAERGFQVP